MELTVPHGVARHSKVAWLRILPFQRFASDTRERSPSDFSMIPILPAPKPPRYEAIVQNGSCHCACPCAVCARVVGFRASNVLETQRRCTRDYKPPISTDWRLAALQLGTAK